MTKKMKLYDFPKAPKAEATRSQQRREGAGFSEARWQVRALCVRTRRNARDGSLRAGENAVANSPSSGEPCVNRAMRY